jgi:glucosamine--fructose-6-phosphate aminotransferase (isomerizing)
MKVLIKKLTDYLKLIPDCLTATVFWGRCPTEVPNHSLVLFPIRTNLLFCGIAGIIAFKGKKASAEKPDLNSLNRAIEQTERKDYDHCDKEALPLDLHYLGGEGSINTALNSVRALNQKELFYGLFLDKHLQHELSALSKKISTVVEKESRLVGRRTDALGVSDVDLVAGRIEKLKDVAWSIDFEIISNINKIKRLTRHMPQPPDSVSLPLFKDLNAVLNSLDRLEVRGRDSAGISILKIFHRKEFEAFKQHLDNYGGQLGVDLLTQLKNRSSGEILLNNSIRMNSFEPASGENTVSIAFTYKVAAEIGSLGDNVNFLRRQIQNDLILQILSAIPCQSYSISTHTRWASVGAITEANCHPVDNMKSNYPSGDEAVIHVCLNGDIDNYQRLKSDLAIKGILFNDTISTDTKIIPLQIEKYLNEGNEIETAFRLAVNDFEGSHAISMHTDLFPGKLFLSQKGSGQSLFIGLAEDHYFPASEVYGFVESTQRFIKVDGESLAPGKAGTTQGQIFILDQHTTGGLDGIKAMYYDGTPVALSEASIITTDITSRDIDRQEYSHYFLKEISESPNSVAQTLHNRWEIKDARKKQYAIHLDDKALPLTIRDALVQNRIKKIFFVGQGTAGVAALACANIMNYYLNDPDFLASALKASELSGFQLSDGDTSNSMADTLVVAISQSGTTTDTNKTIDMVKERGAHTLAIVNRRDSDITFKVDGVLYTSSGRDIEMSVASTKAFYSQIIAGALLGLFIADLKKCRGDDFISMEVHQLLEIPTHMKKILTMQDKIAQSAKRLAPAKTYWAAVGSGPNKASADEIRIKLSELCYKTISSDFVEDKKHIDLSSEPLIIICAAGTRSTVLGDIIKDTAIFKAHKSTPIVITDAGETRFDPYAMDVFHVPAISEHLAPILNTLVGHIWGYHAALAINDGSRLLYRFRKDIQKTVEDLTGTGTDIYEVLLENTFKEKIASFYETFNRVKTENNFPTAIGIKAASDLPLLLKYLAGRLPVSDFNVDFGIKGTPVNILDTLFRCLGESINKMSRPVDAIKHQAKTVTVGTSRISEKMTGILFDTLDEYHMNISQLIHRNVIVLKNLQEIISGIKGAILYRIDHLNLLGEPTDETTIEVIDKAGVLKPIPSRVESDNRIKGTKKIIARQGNVYIGKGRKDDRSIVVIPVISASPAKPNIMEYMLLLNVEFKTDVSRDLVVRALGGKHEHIKNIVQESSITWEDKYLEMVPIDELFGRSAEKISEKIIAGVKGGK